MISRVVLEARRQLTGCPVGALSELVERLARQRLLLLHSEEATGVVVLPS